MADDRKVGLNRRSSMMLQRWNAAGAGSWGKWGRLFIRRLSRRGLWLSGQRRGSGSRSTGVVTCSSLGGCLAGGCSVSICLELYRCSIIVRESYGLMLAVGGCFTIEVVSGVGCLSMGSTTSGMVSLRGDLCGLSSSFSMMLSLSSCDSLPQMRCFLPTPTNMLLSPFTGNCSRAYCLVGLLGLRYCKKYLASLGMFRRCIDRLRLDMCNKQKQLGVTGQWSADHRGRGNLWRQTGQLGEMLSHGVMQLVWKGCLGRHGRRQTGLQLSRGLKHIEQHSWLIGCDGIRHCFQCIPCSFGWMKYHSDATTASTGDKEQTTSQISYSTSSIISRKRMPRRIYLSRVGVFCRMVTVANPIATNFIVFNAFANSCFILMVQSQLGSGSSSEVGMGSVAIVKLSLSYGSQVCIVVLHSCCSADAGISMHSFVRVWAARSAAQTMSTTNMVHSPSKLWLAILFAPYPTSSRNRGPISRSAVLTLLTRPCVIRSQVLP